MPILTTCTEDPAGGGAGGFIGAVGPDAGALAFCGGGGGRPLGAGGGVAIGAGIIITVTVTVMLFC